MDPSPKPSVQLIVDASGEGKRADQFISERFRITRSKIKRGIEAHTILLNDKPLKPATHLRKKDQVTINWPYASSPGVTGGSRMLPEDIPLEIIYEDDDLFAVNKEAKFVTHPAPGHPNQTMMNAILHYHPGACITHRLDKGTSGVLLVAKNEWTLEKIQTQFKNRQIKKTYQALVWGKFKLLHGSFKTVIGRSLHDRKKMSSQTQKGREAHTDYRVLEELGPITFVEAYPKTGRTHQIRVHFKESHHPLVGDPVYGPRGDLPYVIEDFPHQALHAYQLELTHPRTKERLIIVAPLRQDMRELLNKLRLSLRGL
ncbi:MAG: RluA family pseudouridine synthase [Deltaproteobacteria bacterium]|nr:RluA family pseudouridine synthase [Deltaproteobacteria bacterium]